MGAKIADNSPLAILEMKRLFRHGLTQDFEGHSHHVLMSVLNLFKSRDFGEAVTAYMEKRRPNSRGDKRDRPQVAPKIVIIGAGSLEFSSRLTADCLSYPALAGATLRSSIPMLSGSAMPVEFLTESLRQVVTRLAARFMRGDRSITSALNS